MPSRAGETDRGPTNERFQLEPMNQTAPFRHTPSAIPCRGWRDVFMRVYRNVETNRVIIVAAGVSFYSLLAIFPAIAAMVAIYGLFADPATISSHLDSASGLLPGGAIEIIRDQLTRTASRGAGTLGFTFFGGLAFS